MPGGVAGSQVVLQAAVPNDVACLVPMFIKLAGRVPSLLLVFEQKQPSVLYAISGAVRKTCLIIRASYHIRHLKVEK